MVDVWSIEHSDINQVRSGGIISTNLAGDETGCPVTKSNLERKQKYAGNVEYRSRHS